MRLINGECLQSMDKLISEGVKVDAIITDPPYGTTACKWDSVIPFDAMWERLNKLIKPNGAIVLFGSQPFTSALIMSNPKYFKYELIWDKKRTMEPQLANIRPMKCHENIIVFGDGRLTYNPQKIKLDKPDKRKASGRMNNRKDGTGHNILCSVNSEDKVYNDRFPLSISRFSNANQKEKTHPTQKPVALMEYLIKTYTNEGETVLDFTAGSGSTLVACQNTNREGIGIELDEGYFKIMQERLD